MLRRNRGFFSSYIARTFGTVRAETFVRLRGKSSNTFSEKLLPIRWPEERQKMDNAITAALAKDASP